MVTMGFLQRIFAQLQIFFETLLAGSSPEVKKKQQLREFCHLLKDCDPPLVRADGYLLPAFPAGLFQLYQIFAPVRETLTATVAQQDKRKSEKYRDYLLELAFTPDQRAQRKAATLQDRLTALSARTAPAERMIEDQGKVFGFFLKSLESKQMQNVETLLNELDALADFCVFDFNSFFAFFDPAFRAHEGLTTTVETPSFKAIDPAEVVPALLDLYYVVSRLNLTDTIQDLVSILDAKKNGVPLEEEVSSRVSKIFQSGRWLLANRVGPETILRILRVQKNDPSFAPDLPTQKSDYVAQYKSRITEQFHSDSRKMLKDRELCELNDMIANTFGSIQLETIEGYSESTNTLIQEFTTSSLEWIQPLEIIKTFAIHFFAPYFSSILKSLIVEGYFNNRTLQTTLSAAYYYCESVTGKILEFETLFRNDQQFSVKKLTAYLTELQNGMDFASPIRKLIGGMNGQAKVLVQQAVNQYAEVYNFANIIIDDSKRTVPEYITNIRTLTASAKNSDSFAAMEREIGVFRNFLEIMKKYAIVGTLSNPVGISEQTES